MSKYLNKDQKSKPRFSQMEAVLHLWPQAERRESPDVAASTLVSVLLPSLISGPLWTQALTRVSHQPPSEQSSLMAWRE